MDKHSSVALMQPSRVAKASLCPYLKRHTTWPEEKAVAFQLLLRAAALLTSAAVGRAV